ncbi:Formyltetrahydrofolate hydrolase (plasmid) [Halapricum desulfuricans]|uniref:Formyltetrahydrofolate hydrolase n=1 Tax=Halapricum desulfuricans TaxID=2841257 RepID=A0A897NU66_9EURY|nr:Formyltetrahydrofolate hydrolase [Halapricum desulfuricans]
MRVVLFTSAEPLYLPRYLQPLFEAHADTIDQVVIAPFNASPAEQLRSQAGMYGARAGIRMALRYGRSRALDALPGQVARRATGRYHSVPAVARAYGVPVERIPDVSDPTFVERMEDLAPDLLLSIVAGQRLPGPVLESADDAVNLHGSLLPKYRGRATVFWPLFYGDDRTGITAHRMTEHFDAGPILAQRAFPSTTPTPSIRCTANSPRRAPHLRSSCLPPIPNCQPSGPTRRFQQAITGFRAPRSDGSSTSAATRFFNGISMTDTRIVFSRTAETYHRLGASTRPTVSRRKSAR